MLYNRKHRTETGFIKWTTEDEFFALIEEVNKERNKPLWRSVMYMLFYMGLRRKEVAQVKWIDIIGNFDRVRIRDVKNGEIRERVIPTKVREELLIYSFAYRRFQSPGVFMFESPRDGGSKREFISPNTITFKFARWRNKAGIDDWYYERKEGARLARVTPHTLRHWFITQVYEKSDLLTAQRIIGHKKSQTTARYVFKNNLLETELNIVETL
jgi:integrase